VNLDDPAVRGVAEDIMREATAARVANMRAAVGPEGQAFARAAGVPEDVIQEVRMEAENLAARMGGNPAPADAQAEPRRQANARPAAPAAPAAEPNAALPQRGGKGRPGAAPVAPAAAAPVAAARPNAMRVLREAGFQPCGTPQGPALKLEDGDRKALVTGVGRSLALATSFVVRILDAAGEVEAERTIDDATEAAEWAAGAVRASPGPRR
jgi:hypothetical protein